MTAFYIDHDFLAREIARLQREEEIAAGLNTLGNSPDARALLEGRDLLPGPPYTANTEALLSGVYMGGNIIGYELLTVVSTEVAQLANIPPKAKKAIMFVEADATAANQTKVIRFKCGEDPTANLGMPAGNNGVFECGRAYNLTRFRVIGIEAGKTHKIQVQYEG